MFESNSTPCQEKAKQPRLSRSRITAEVVEFEAAAGQGTSQRQFAQERGLPRSTLQYWLSRKAGIDAEPELIAFFESPAGLKVKFEWKQQTADDDFAQDHSYFFSSFPSPKNLSSTVLINCVPFTNHDLC